MTKREKIILIVMTIVIIYGAYEIFFASSEENSEPSVKIAAPTAPKTNDTPRFLTDLLKKIPPKNKQSNQKIVLKTAAEAWGSDPFLEKPLDASNADNVARVPLPTGRNLIYSGYIEIGNRRLAIINGLEYEISETIEPGGYVLKDISPAAIRVGYASGNKDFIVSLEEMDSIP